MGITVDAGKMPVFQKIRQGGLKSRKEKLERQQNRDNEVAVLEKQKAALKNKECDSVEEIEDKVKLFHSYEEQIKAVKHAFNSEQMCHVLDEAREKGEKFAEELKKHSAKTPEEMKKILEEEALGIEDSQGMLSELLSELTVEIQLELTGDEAGELTEEMVGELTGDAAKELTEDETVETTGGLTGKAAENPAGDKAEEWAESITEVRIRESAEKTVEERIRERQERTDAR